MASTLQASSFFFLLLLLLSYVSTEVVARKSTPKDSKKQPQTVFNDGTVLVPGLGRYMLPKAGGFRSLDYNPITGAPGWNGVSIRGTAGPNGKHNYIPGLDDTIFPNPGVEFPNPFRPTPNP